MPHLTWYIAYAANFLSMSCHMSATLLPIYWKGSGFEDWEIGWLAAGFSLAAILSRLGLGYGLERWGRKPFLILGAILLNLTVGCYVLVDDRFFWWLALRAIQGVGLGCYITAILTWVADRSAPEKIGQIQGVFGVSGLLGAAAGPWLAEYVYRNHGFPMMFSTIFAAGIVCCLLVAVLPESGRNSGSILSPRKSLQLKDHRAMICVTLPFGWLTGTIITFIAPFVESVGLQQVGVYFAAFAFASVCVRVFAARSIDLLSAERLVILSGGSLALGGLAVSSLAILPETAVLITAALLNGLGHGFLFPGLSTHIVRKTAATQRGAGIALFTGTFDLGILVGALAAGYISQNLGYSWAFLIGSGLLSMSLPLFTKLNKSKE